MTHCLPRHVETGHGQRMHMICGQSRSVLQAGTAFATLSNVRGTLTPQLRGDGSVLVLVDLAAGKARLGGSILAQVLGGFGGAVPDLDDATRLRGL